MSEWVVAQGSAKCQRCGEIIGAGEVMKLVTVGRWAWCAPCVKAVIGDEPPKTITPLASWMQPKYSKPEFQKFSTEDVNAALRVARRGAEMPSREPGEEG